MANKDKYRSLCQNEPTIPIFSRDWWLDTVCSHGIWDVSIVEKNGEIVASLPYYSKKIYGKSAITMPPLTQTMGPWIKYPPGQKLATKISYEKDILKELISKLPRFDYFEQNFHHSVTNWLPFFWNKFNQTTRYTYIIRDLSNADRLFSDLRENIRRNIRKAEKELTVKQGDDVEKFYQLNQKTFERQNRKIPYPFTVIKKIDVACSSRNARKILFAENSQGDIHASVYIIWDENSAYYLMGGSDPLLRNSGANSLLLWEAIKFAAGVTRTFDFEGSMIEPIERFFRAFGAEQIPYYYVTKINSKILKFAKLARKFFE